MENRVISKVKKAKAAWHPSLLCYQAGRLPDGVSRTEGLSHLPEDYQDFVKITDGAVCGCASFFPVAELGKYQFIVSTLKEDPDNWICIGSVAGEPLLLNTVDAVTQLVVRDDDSTFGYGPITEFLDDWVFGSSYEFIFPGRPKRDEWYEFLKSIDVMQE